MGFKPQVHNLKYKEKQNMAVKIDASILGIKRPIEVKESGRNMKKTLKLQLLLNKQDTESTFVEFAEAQLKTQEAMEDYVISVLKLTDAQAEKLEDLDSEEFGGLIGRISAAILHFDMTDKEVEEEDQGKK